MDPPESYQKGGRARIIPIAASVITVVAIVLAFASGYLGLGWQWLRPAGELLLLAELVGLIVLERHQLFEPVNAKVDNMQADVSALRGELSRLTQRFDSAGQVTFLASPSQTLRGIIRALNEALAREQHAPQMLRWARLASMPKVSSDPELGAELLEMAKAHIAFQLPSGSNSNNRASMWSLRNILSIPSVEAFDYWRESWLPLYRERTPINMEAKLVVRFRTRAEAILTPNLITDHDVVVSMMDDRAAFRWGFLFQGPQYVAVFVRWFDDLWASIPDRYLVQSRNGVDEKALERIRKELEAAEAAGERRTA